MVNITTIEYNREDMNYYENRPNPVEIQFGVAQLNLSPLQFERLKFLADNRYYEEEDIVKFKVTNYLEIEDNKARALEIIQELMLETLRAPRE